MCFSKYRDVNKDSSKELLMLTNNILSTINRCDNTKYHKRLSCLELKSVL